MHTIFNDLFDYIKQYNIHLIKISEGDKIETGTEKLIQIVSANL